MAQASTPLDDLLEGSSPPVHSEVPAIQAEVTALAEAQAEQQRTAGSRRRRGLVVAGGATALVLAGGVTGAAAAPVLTPLFRHTTIVDHRTADLTIPANAIPGQRSCALTFQVIPGNEASRPHVEEASRILRDIDPLSLDLTHLLDAPNVESGGSEVNDIVIQTETGEDAEHDPDQSYTVYVDAGGYVEFAGGSQQSYVVHIDSDDSVIAVETTFHETSGRLSPAESRDRARGTRAIQTAVKARYQSGLIAAGIDPRLGLAMSTLCGSE